MTSIDPRSAFGATAVAALEKARITALEKQNTDLIEIVKELITTHVHIDVNISDRELLLAHNLENLVVGISKNAASLAAQKIEDMLEDRRKFYHDYDLLKRTATRDYYRCVNEELFR